MAKNRITDRFAPTWVGELNTRKSEKAPQVRRISRAKLLEIVTKAPGFKGSLNQAPEMELTARHPYDPAGYMDTYHPGRWDCEYDLVFMHVIVQTGPSPGMWDGTVSYVQFKAPTTGTYLVVGNFSGYQITMNSVGPWGTSTAYCATNQNSAAVTSLWSGSAGQHLYFTLHCTGPVIGYLESIQVFRLS